MAAPEIEVDEEVVVEEVPGEVCAANPSSTTLIPYETKVLITQDEEENWVIIWAECAADSE
jgi:hypothetical protein